MRILVILLVVKCMLMNSYVTSAEIIHVGLQGEFHASDIDPSICTHIIYNHMWFSGGLIQRWSTDEVKLDEFFKLKEVNPNVKLLIGIGGPSWGSSTPSDLVETATSRLDLSNAIKELLNENSRFDGCDIDWQWPAQAGGRIEDKVNYPEFLSLLRSILPSSKILSISVAPRNEDIQKSYDILEITPHVDFINLNAFDLRGVLSDTATAFHSPYRKDMNDRRLEAEWNAISILESWIGRGVEPEKLTLGIPTYGRSFTLSDSNNFNVGSEISGMGRTSNFLLRTRPAKENIIPYAEICSNIQDNNWEKFWSISHFAPYAVFDEDQWVGYDDENTVLAKIHLAIDQNLGGINYASLDYDDFNGLCGPKYPLINLGYKALIDGELPLNPVDPTTTTSTIRPGETTPDITTPIAEVTTETEEITEPDTTTSISTSTSTPVPTTLSNTHTTTKGTTSTRTTLSSITIKTPPVTPNTVENEPITSTTSSTINTEIEKTTEVITTTSTKEFRSPPVTPERNANNENDLYTDDLVTTTEGESEEGSGESSESDSYESSEEESNENIENTTNVDLASFPTSDEIIELPSTTNSDILTCPTANGNYKHLNDCTKFIICANNIPYIFNCQPGLYYDEINDRCDYQSNVPCGV